MLSASPVIDVVGVAANGAEALEQVEKLRPDLVLMDLKMPVMNGVQATRTIMAQFRLTAVLILTTYDDDVWVLDAIRAGAKGYLLKDTGREALLAAIEGTVAGKTHIDPAVADKLFQFVRHGSPSSSTIAEQLSQREREVLRLLASGLTNAAIADRLFLAEGTVRNHVTTILAKLDVDDRAQATAIAWRYGLVLPEV